MINREEKIEQMLQGFVRAFCEYGLDKTTTKKLAHEMNMNEALLYTYFKNKDDIICKCTHYHYTNVMTVVINTMIDADLEQRATADKLIHYLDSVIDIWRFLIQVVSHPKYSQYMEETNAQVYFQFKRYAEHLSVFFDLEEEAAQAVSLFCSSIILDYIVNRNKAYFYTQFRFLEQYVKHKQLV